MRVRQPDRAERPHAHLDAETDEEQGESEGNQARVILEQLRHAGADRVEVIEQPGTARHRGELGAGQQRRANHRNHAGNLHHDHVLAGGTTILGPVPFEPDQGVARQGHHLPENEEEPHHVRRAHQAVHGGEENQQMRIIPSRAFLGVVVEIPDRIQRGRHRHQRGQPQKHRAQPIHMQSQSKPEPFHWEVGGAVTRTEHREAQNGERDQGGGGGGDSQA